MGIRRRGRELALQLLYQIEITGDASQAPLELFWSYFEGNVKAREFARRLIDGVVLHREEIDQLIEQATDNWKITRMPKVDLAILRLASYELLFCPDIPLNVSIDEAIEVSKRFSSEDSATFINGVLDQVAAASGIKS
ncbi:MAG: transcription antitermination factor NusB [Deltaproteobacteria bacterium]|nr:transcription antitermination factor NusB [Deltaproteobacteria bacterium]